MAEKETQIGRAKMKQAPQKPISFKLKDKSVKIKHLDDKIVTPEKLSDSTKQVFEDIMKERTDDLQNQIDSLEMAGVAVSNEFGSDPHIGISQKTLTDAINAIWSKIEDITGDVIQGISMSVTPEYFIGEDGCNVHIMASTVHTNGIFEHIAFYANGNLIAESSNVDYFEYETEFTDTTIVQCVAKVLGVEYTAQKVVTHYNSFWLGAGATYGDIMDVQHVIPVGHHMRGAHELEVGNGEHIIIIMGASLSGEFIRADINGVEIAFNETTVTIDDNEYKVFTSENTFAAGTYNIDING